MCHLQWKKHFLFLFETHYFQIVAQVSLGIQSIRCLNAEKNRSVIQYFYRLSLNTSEIIIKKKIGRQCEPARTYRFVMKSMSSISRYGDVLGRRVRLACVKLNVRIPAATVISC